MRFHFGLGPKDNHFASGKSMEAMRLTLPTVAGCNALTQAQLAWDSPTMAASAPTVARQTRAWAASRRSQFCLERDTLNVIPFDLLGFIPVKDDLEQEVTTIMKTAKEKIEAVPFTSSKRRPDKLKKGDEARTGRHQDGQSPDRDQA